jgi:hypothetical protein
MYSVSFGHNHYEMSLTPDSHIIQDGSEKFNDFQLLGQAIRDTANSNEPLLLSSLYPL